MSDPTRSNPTVSAWVDRISGVVQRIVDDSPALQRGMVWCRQCGRSEKVDSAECLRSGWPKCCGYTMTIDEPTDV